MESEIVERTNLRGLHDFSVLERIKVILDIHRRAFLDGPSAEERIGRLENHAYCYHLDCHHKTSLIVILPNRTSF